MIGFEFGFKAIIDILLVASMLYEIYVLLRRSGVTNLFWGVLVFVIMWILVSYVFELELTGALFDKIINAGAIALIVIFQEEIRAFFLRLGSRFSAIRLYRSRRRLAETMVIDEVMTACQHMSKTKTGALIILAGKQDLEEYIETGEVLDATVSARLVENIFFKNTPLHDGALIIDGNRMVAAACILPVSKSTEISTSYGLRHRAALGLTERTDATAIVVSEETGHLSVAHEGEIRTMTESEIRSYLTAA